MFDADPVLLEQIVQPFIPVPVYHDAVPVHPDTSQAVGRKLMHADKVGFALIFIRIRVYVHIPESPEFKKGPNEKPDLVLFFIIGHTVTGVGVFGLHKSIGDHVLFDDPDRGVGIDPGSFHDRIIDLILRLVKRMEGTDQAAAQERQDQQHGENL
jgi:hypothetical protein